MKKMLITLIYFSMLPLLLGANVWTDSNCKALWRFESGALTADSKGGNTFTNVGVIEDTSDYKEGSCSANYTTASDRFQISDGDLDAGFPLKSGDTNKKISVAVWVNISTQPANNRYIFYKAVASNNSIFIAAYWDGSKTVIRLAISSTGSNWISYNHASAITLDQWYHIVVTYQDSDQVYRIRIWDNTAQEILGVDKTGTAVNVFVGTGTVYTGYANPAYDMLGHHDEMVVFDDILSVAEIDAIRAGTYGAGAGQVIIVETD